MVKLLIKCLNSSNNEMITNSLKIFNEMLEKKIEIIFKFWRKLIEHLLKVNFKKQLSI